MIFLVDKKWRDEKIANQAKSGSGSSVLVVHSYRCINELISSEVYSASLSFSTSIISILLPGLFNFPS